MYLESVVECLASLPVDSYHGMEDVLHVVICFVVHLPRPATLSLTHSQTHSVIRLVLTRYVEHDTSRRAFTGNRVR